MTFVNKSSVEKMTYLTIVKYLHTILAKYLIKKKISRQAVQ